MAEPMLVGKARKAFRLKPADTAPVGADPEAACGVLIEGEDPSIGKTMLGRVGRELPIGEAAEPRGACADP